MGALSGDVDAITKLFSLFLDKKSMLFGYGVGYKELPMTERTIFHRIIDREIPSTILHEDAEVLVIKDIRPKAQTHLLFLPKTFAPSVAELTPETQHLPGLLIVKAKEFAARHGIDGYKLVFHVGASGGQEVFYLHLHFLSQQEMRMEKAIA